MRVRWDDGAPGADVMFQTYGGEHRTDADGFAIVRAPGRDSTLTLREFIDAGRGVRRSAHVKTDAGVRREVCVEMPEEGDATVNVVLRKAMHVSGRVVDAAGDPVPGAVVNLRFGRAGQEPLDEDSWGAGVTALDGRFSVGFPPSFNEYVAVWGLDVFSPNEGHVTNVRRDGVPTDDVDLGDIIVVAEGWILVRVRTPSGLPASGAVLEASIESVAPSSGRESGAADIPFDEAPGWISDPSAKFEPTGEFLFCVGRGRWRVTATDDAGGYAEATSAGGGSASAPRVVPLTLNATRAALRFARSPTVLVYEVDDGATVENVWVGARDDDSLTVRAGVPLRIRVDRARVQDGLRGLGFPCDRLMGPSWGPTLEMAPLAPGETRRIGLRPPGPRRPLAVRVVAHDGALAAGAEVALFVAGEHVDGASCGPEFVAAVPVAPVTLRARWVGVAAEASAAIDVDSVVITMPKTRRAYLALRMPAGAGGVWATASVGDRAVEVHSSFEDGWFYAVTHVGVDDALTFVLDACGRTSRHTAPPGTERVYVETPPHGWARFEAVSPIPKGLPGLLEVRRAGTGEVVHHEELPPRDGSLLRTLPPLPLAQGSFVATLRFREPEDGGWMSLLPPRPVEIVEGSTVVVAF
ncbi:MAG TPA: hypothetical protein VEI02_08170 [Planctomycetota bacterium]|nr:hypothetical protein [Planctomycetota bacterium]